MLTDSHATGFNINIWESKIVKKLTTNANYYPTEALRMTYVDSHVDGKVYKHLAAKLRISAQKPFATTEKIFEVLQKAYGNVNRAYTAMNKFWDLKMTKNFNTFWAKFQVLASKLDHNEATLISKLKYKLTLLLSQAIAGGVSRLKDIHEYAQQCQLAYQDLKNIKLLTPAANFSGNQYRGSNTNTSTSTSTKIAGQQANRNKRPANSVYSYSFSMVSNLVFTRPACSKATRLTWEKIAKLQREDCCFTCKEVGNHRLKCSNGWRLISVFTNADSALARINVSKVGVPQPGHMKAENKWPPQKSLWAVRSCCWFLPLVYQTICLSMRPSWLHIA